MSPLKASSTRIGLLRQVGVHGCHAQPLSGIIKRGYQLGKEASFFRFLGCVSAEVRIRLLQRRRDHPSDGLFSHPSAGELLVHAQTLSADRGPNTTTRSAEIETMTGIVIARTVMSAASLRTSVAYPLSLSSHPECRLPLYRLYGYFNLWGSPNYV